MLEVQMKVCNVIKRASFFDEYVEIKLLCCCVQCTRQNHSIACFTDKEGAWKREKATLFRYLIIFLTQLKNDPTSVFSKFCGCHLSGDVN